MPTFLINRAPVDATGALVATATVPTSTWPFLGGFAYDPVTMALAIIQGTPPADHPYVGGIRTTHLGQVYVTTTPPNPIFYVGGIPVDGIGRIFGSGSPPIGTTGGWPIAGDGGVSIGSGLGPQAPSVITTAATSVTAFTATLNGLVTSNGASTTVTFEYGLDTSYGNTVAGVPSPVAAAGASVPVSANITGLLGATLYHFRVKGVNAQGTGLGADLTFNTAVLPAELFNAPLMTTLVPVSAANPTFTFNRATVAYGQNNEGMLRLSEGYEARFRGARRVENYIRDTQNYVPSNWQFTGCTVATGVLGPTGLLDAATVTSTAASGMARATGICNYVLGASLVGSIWLRRRAGTGRVDILDPFVNGTQVALTSTWQRFSTAPIVSAQDSNVGVNVGIFFAAAGDQVDIAYPQCERVEVRANKAPSEYVSVGVLPAPFHGNGIDSIKYFNTTNGNSIASNLFNYSQDFDNSFWFKDRCTMVVGALAPDGTTTAFTFTDDATNGSHVFNQVPLSGLSFPQNQFPANKPYTFSVYLKAGTLTWAQLQAPDASGTQWVNVNLVTGLIGNVAPGVSATNMIALPNGWYRCSVTLTPTSQVLGAMGVTSCLSDVNHLDDVYTGSGQTMLVWGAQVEKNPVASRYTVTTDVRVDSIVVEAPGLPLPVGPFTPANLLTNSQNFERVPSWNSDPGGLSVTPNAIAAPDGTVTADMVVEGAGGTYHRLYQLIGCGNAVYTASIYLKAGTGQWVQVDYFTGAFQKFANFDLVNGVIGNRDGQPGSVPTMTPVGNGWYRCSITFAGVPAGSNLSIYLIPSDVPTPHFSYLGTGKTMYWWGAQLEQAGAATTYSPTGDAINTIPTLGYLAESAASNLCQQSQTFTDVGWNKLGCTVVAQSVAAPDGTITATLFTDDASAGPHRVAGNSAVAAAGSVYTGSMYVKQGTLPWAHILLFDGASGFFWANINLATGQLGFIGAGTTIAVQNLPNGWFRISVTGTLPGTAARLQMFGMNADINGTTPAYTGSGQTMYIWGAQTELGPLATSYIPTTTVAVTRVYETLEYDKSNFLIAVGTASADMVTYSDPADTNPHGAIATDQGWMLAVWTGYKLSNNIGSSAVSTANAPSPGVMFRGASRWQTTPKQEAVILNAATLATLVPATGGAKGNVLRIGNYANSSNSALRGTIRNVVIKSIALSDSEMIAVTQPVMPDPTFNAPFTLSLIPAACGDYVYTYARATTAYVADQDGVLRFVAANESRFSGARRVRNIVGGTTDMANATYWPIGGTGSATVTPGQLAPDGTLTAYKITNVAGNEGPANVTQIADVTLTRTQSVWARGELGNEQLVLGGGTVLPAPLTTQWQRYAITEIATNAAMRVRCVGGPGSIIYAWQPQCEIVNGQANTAPSEFQSIGQPTGVSVFTGGINGVRCYDTTNSGNVRPTNMLRQSQTFTVSPWANDNIIITPDTTLAPDGTTTASTFADNATNAEHRLLTGSLAINGGGTFHTASIYVKKGTLSWMRFYVDDAVTGYLFYFNLASGVIGSTVNPASAAAFRVQALSNGWYRLSISFPSTGTLGLFDVNAASADGTVGYAGSGQTMFVWGAQWERSNVATTYNSTTTFFQGKDDGNVVYSNFYPMTPIPAANLLGYFAEDTATNICIRSQEFNLGWNKSNSVVTPDTQYAPDGTLTADVYADNATNATHRVSLSAVNYAAAPYTFSVYVKAGTLTWFQLAVDDGAAKWANFNIQTGVVGSVGAGVTPNIQSLANGWYRCAISFTATATAGGFVKIISLNADTGAPDPPYVGTGQTMFLWGAQAESSLIASSYIPTTTVPVTRNIDALSYPVQKNIDLGLGSLTTEFTLAQPTGTFRNTIRWVDALSNVVQVTNSNIINCITTALGGAVFGTAGNKVADGWCAGLGLSGVANNGAVQTAAFAGFPSTGNVLISSNSTGVWGNLRNVKFYNIRLEDYTLKGLTL